MQYEDYVFNKKFGPKFLEIYHLKQTPEEAQRLQQLKHGDNNNQNKKHSSQYFSQ